MTTVRERYPEVFVERHEDPRKRTRTVPMQVLSLRMSRTGTMTMKAAYETLGIPTWHWVTMSENPPDMAMWVETLQSKYSAQPSDHPINRTAFDNLLGSWGAVTDQPANAFASELITAYPEAKIVLVERDVDRWYQSFSNTVINGSANPFIPLISLVDKVYIGQMAALTDEIVRDYFHVRESRTWWGVFINPDFFAQWRATAKDVYRAHNAMVKRITPKERLLVFRLEEPLCKFSDKPVPDMPFPRVNETQVAQEMVNTYILQGYKRWAIKFVKRTLPVPVAAVGALAFWKGTVGR